MELSYNSRFLLNKMTFVIRMAGVEDVMVTVSTNNQVQLFLIVPNFVYRAQKNPRHTEYITLDDFARMTNQVTPDPHSCEQDLQGTEEHFDTVYQEEIDYAEQQMADMHLEEASDVTAQPGDVQIDVGEPDIEAEYVMDVAS